MASNQQYFSCGNCGRKFRRMPTLKEHRTRCHPDPLPDHHGAGLPQDTGAASPPVITRYLHRHALSNSARVIRFVPVDSERFLHPEVFFNLAMPHIQESFNQLLKEDIEVRVHFVLQVRVVRRDAQGRVRDRDRAIFSLPALSLNEVSMEDIIQRLLAQIEIYTNKGSDWMIEGVDFFDFCVTRYRSVPHLRGHGFFELPRKLKNKHAVVNVNNTGSDHDCFKYAILSVLYYNEVARNKRGIASKYHRFMNTVNWEGLDFPMTAKQVAHFESNNPSLRVNMLKWHAGENETHPVSMIYHSKSPVKEGQRIISVLAVDRPTGSTEGPPCHFVGVTDLNKLLSSQGQHKHYCERCLQPFRTTEYLGKHRPFCYTNTRETLVPAKGTFHRFDQWGKMQKVPYVVYADIECTLSKQDDRHLERHTPAAFGFLLVGNPELVRTPIPNRYQVFVGDNCIEDGLTALEDLARQVHQWHKTHIDVPVRMNNEEKVAHRTADTCYLCQQKFVEGDPLKRKVREHDHYTGQYRGAACQACNTKMRKNPYYLPVLFHNLKNYDMHCLCASGLGKKTEWNLTVIAQSSEKYLGLNAKFPVDSQLTDSDDDDTSDEEDYGENECSDHANTIKKRMMTIQFLDSYQFLASSLDNLVRNLDLTDMHHCRALNLPSDELIKAKGVFPYSYFDSLDKMQALGLPPREAFKSSLTGNDISQADYDRARRAYDLLGCNNFGEYMLAYLKRDVYQLADIFESFRTLSLKQDGLDPVYYYTLPGLTWDSAFKMHKPEVELLSDPSMYEFVEKGIRGGMTFVNFHRLVANTPRIPETHQAERATQDLLYVDENNLYGNALCQKLPQKEFKWLSKEDLATLDILTYDFTGDTGLLLEVDLEYPPEVQDRSKDLPFAPESHEIVETMLTPFQKDQWKALMEQRYGNPNKAYTGCTKLMLTHYDKTNYVVHGQLLQFYVKQGMKIRQIHRGLSFFQSAFFASYIQYNSEKRQQASNTFEKDYYKLKNNALFGKTMENVRNRMNYRLANSEQKLITLASRPEFMSSTIFNPDLVGVRLTKQRITLDKPIYIGQAVLELSKLTMYQLRYDHLNTYAKHFGGHIKVAGGDTDSFFLWIHGFRADHLLEKMKEDGLLDSSNYPSNHPLYSEEHKARLGCIKDEAEGDPFIEWYLLRPKCYSMKAYKGKDKMRAKGVSRSTLGNEITHASYKQAYNNQVCLSHEQRRINSEKHETFTLKFTKVSLNFWEDKRAWVSKNLSLPYGHHTLTTERRPPLKRVREDDLLIAPIHLEPAKKCPRVD